VTPLGVEDAPGRVEEIITSIVGLRMQQIAEAEFDRVGMSGGISSFNAVLSDLDLRIEVPWDMTRDPTLRIWNHYQSK